MNKKNVLLIDGGMGQELIYRSKIKPDGLWGARVMLDNYELVAVSYTHLTLPTKA